MNMDNKKTRILAINVFLDLNTAQDPRPDKGFSKE